MKTLLLGALPFFSLTGTFASETKNILIILSGENKITVNMDTKGMKTYEHPTGFFLSELTVPLKALMEEGYTPTFAAPTRTLPVMDNVSDDAFWFGGDKDKHAKYRQLCELLGVCGKGLVGTIKTKSFADIKDSLESFDGVFFPGGHAPMEDLYKSKELGQILMHFHLNRKPTALICHAPIALLSTLNNPEQFGMELEKLNILQKNSMSSPEEIKAVENKIQELKKDWPYENMNMTVFSTQEEKQEEPGEDNVLGGYVKFYPDQALRQAGGLVEVNQKKWQSKVVRHEELITGENPMSDSEFAKTLLKALKEWQETKS